MSSRILGPPGDLRRDNGSAGKANQLWILGNLFDSPETCTEQIKLGAYLYQGCFPPPR